MADSCPIFEHLRGSQGVCEAQPAHFDLIAAVQVAAAQRDRTAAVERARGLGSARRDRAVVSAALASFRGGRLVGTRQRSAVTSEPVDVTMTVLRPQAVTR